MPSTTRDICRENDEFLQILGDHLEVGNLAAILRDSPESHVDQRMAVLTVRAQMFLEIGLSEQCRLTVATALQAARSGCVANHLVATAISTGGWAAFSLGEVGTALRLARDAAGACPATSPYSPWRAVDVLIAACLAAQDRFQEAKDTLRCDVPWTPEVHLDEYDYHDSLIDLERARIHLALDEVSAAFEVLDRALAFLARAPDTPSLRVIGPCLRAQILLRCGRLSEARTTIGNVPLRVGARESEALAFRWTRVLLNTASRHFERTEHDVRWLTSRRTLAQLFAQEPLAAIVLTDLARHGHDLALGSRIRRTITTVVDRIPSAASLRAAMLCADTLSAQNYPTDYVAAYAEDVARPQVTDYIVDRRLINSALHE
ncbi:MAG TPA: hypothetical protein VGM60_17370 [Pseudonocardia sp.]|jgi:hypothetical protein|uniref:hypothetical protein n=1 Tax=Pseudonocardia sp. TaxID=60912 RepID=UPI002F3F71AA